MSARRIGILVAILVAAGWIGAIAECVVQPAERQAADGFVLTVTRIPSPVIYRGDQIVPGDRLEIRVRGGAGQFAIRVYRNDHRLQTCWRCSEMTVDVDELGLYEVHAALLPSDGRCEVPHTGHDEDLAALYRCGAEVRSWMGHAR